MTDDADSPETEAKGRSAALHRLEFFATLLLALATVATAWSGYEATRWGQEVTKATAAVNAARATATRADDRANSQTNIDVETFSSWVDAFATGETELADFYFARFREEFKPAVDAWVATMPLQNPDAPLTPFAMPEYRLAAREEAMQQDEIVAVKAAEVRTNIQRQSNYVFAVVLFATVLFFAGASTRITSANLRRIVLGMGCVIFIATLVWLATFPVSVSV